MLQIECFVTTAPRPENYLPQTCISLFDAGFDPVIFAEPKSPIPQEFSTRTTFNSTMLGAWHNWKSAVTQILSWSDADYFLSCQDDITVHPEAKKFCFEFIERYKAKEYGYLSLYTPTHYTITGGEIQPKPPGVTEMGVPAAYGACCLLFPRKILEDMRKTSVWTNWLGVPAQENPLGVYEERRANPQTIKHVDAAITRMLIELKLSLLYPIPSVCQHVGEHSALGHARAAIPTDGSVSRRVAQRLVDYTKPLIPQIFGE